MENLNKENAYKNKIIKMAFKSWQNIEEQKKYPMHFAKYLKSKNLDNLPKELPSDWLLKEQYEK